MARSPARFTQADVTKLLKAAKGAGFDCVTVEVMTTGDLRATYSAGLPEPTANEWDVVFEKVPTQAKRVR